MSIEVKVPLLPESVADATISAWHKKAGDKVTRDENIVDLETDKVMLEVPAPADGILKEILKNTGETVHAQDVIAIVEEGAAAGKEMPQTQQSVQPSDQKQEPSKSAESGKSVESKTASSQPQTTQPSPKQVSEPPLSSKERESMGPSARRAAAEGSLGARADTNKTQQTTQSQGERLEGGEKQRPEPSFGTDTAAYGERQERRVPMTRIRARIAERLLDVKQNTAMLTTFNEINMSAVMGLRNRYRDKFEKKYKVRLGFMSFFVKAVVEALKQAPVVNGSIDGNDIVYHNYYDIGVAVSTDRGLVVPVLRNADQMSMADIESKIVEYAEKARAGKLALEEMQGGTFTITNGGVFGSLMATPIINAPQCAILGMHKIEERPMVENGQIVARPMMYVALSYDHRLIDGKESVTFLVTIKDYLEDPTRIILEV